MDTGRQNGGGHPYAPAVGRICFLYGLVRYVGAVFCSLRTWSDYRNPDSSRHVEGDGSGGRRYPARAAYCEGRILFSGEEGEAEADETAGGFVTGKFPFLKSFRIDTK